jgi:hypothetical protein
VRAQLVAIVDEMHHEGLLRANPEDEDRVVTLIKKKP